MRRRDIVMIIDFKECVEWLWKTDKDNTVITINFGTEIRCYQKTEIRE